MESGSKVIWLHCLGSKLVNANFIKVEEYPPWAQPPEVPQLASEGGFENWLKIGKQKTVLHRLKTSCNTWLVSWRNPATFFFHKVEDSFPARLHCCQNCKAASANNKSLAISRKKAKTHRLTLTPLLIFGIGLVLALGLTKPRPCLFDTFMYTGTRRKWWTM